MSKETSTPDDGKIDRRTVLTVGGAITVIAALGGAGGFLINDFVGRYSRDADERGRRIAIDAIEQANAANREAESQAIELKQTAVTGQPMYMRLMMGWIDFRDGSLSGRRVVNPILLNGWNTPFTDDSLQGKWFGYQSLAPDNTPGIIPVYFDKDNMHYVPSRPDLYKGSLLEKPSSPDLDENVRIGVPVQLLGGLGDTNLRPDIGYVVSAPGQVDRSTGNPTIPGEFTTAGL